MNRAATVFAIAILFSLAAGVRGLRADPAPPDAPGQRRPLALDDVSLLRSVGDPRLSPDGAWVAYTVTTTNVEADRMQSDLWMTSWDGASTLRLTTTAAESEAGPRWSPDGRRLAFLSSRGDLHDAAQVWLLPVSGGEAEQVTRLRAGVTDFAWSPDGTRLVLAVADSDSVSRVRPAGRDATPPPIVIDRFYFKEDVTGYLTHKRTHLVLCDLASGKVESLTRGDNDDLVPAWSPDGRAIAFLSKRGPEADRSNSWEVYVVEPRAGAEPRQVTRFEGAINNPGGEAGVDAIAWSPDANQIAFLRGGPPGLIYYAVNHLAIVSVAGGPVRVLTAGVDRWVSSPTWAPDGRSVFVSLEDDRAVGLVRVPLDGGPPVPVIGGRRAVTGFSVSPSGRVAALVSASLTAPEVFAVEGQALRPLSRQNDSLLAGLRLGAVEETRFRSRDGTVVSGFMVKPPGYREGVRYPAILRIHGGPVSQFQCELQAEWQLLAARGWLVVAANPRGSSGRGEAFANAINADWGNKDAQDVLAAVDDAVARGLADPGRLGIGGWSYGGMLTNYVIAQDRRFRAATSGASISNVIAGYGTDMYVREYEGELGTPWSATAKYLKLSFPFLHADRIVTPTLFLCGDEDFDVPLLNSEQMYQALRSLGRETQLVIYPGQTHGLSKPSYIRDRLQRYLDWYDRFLK